MPVHVGRNYVAIPGPTVVPDQVLNAMHRMAPNIYASELSDMVGEIIEDLKTVARTRNHVAIYVANGHGAWEAALSNMASRGDKILILSTGFFSNRWGEMADAMGIIVEHLVFDYNQGVDPERVADRLKNDTDNHIKAVLSVHVDTATSARNEIFPVTRAIRATGHPALFAVDCIASLACEPFEMDEWEVDVVVAGTQKGLMTPRDWDSSTLATGQGVNVNIATCVPSIGTGTVELIPKCSMNISAAPLPPTTCLAFAKRWI